MNIAIIHCDGSFSRLRNASGYGVVIQFKGKIIEFYESYIGSLSPARAELLGAIRAIEVFGPRADRLHIYSDSKYVIDGASVNLPKWISNKWNKPITNKELWLKLAGLMKQYQIEWTWVRGHDGNVYNERADELAKQAVLESV